MVAARYDRGVEGYVDLWSPVILPAAQALVARMALEATATVIDVGAGSGAVVPAIRDSAPRGRLIGVDASPEMLRIARDRTDALVVLSDAVALPVRADSADAVLLAFVLFHLSNPIEGLAEAHRVLHVGGVVGTATWAQSNAITPAAYGIWDRTLTEGGAPPVPEGRVDAGLDSADAIESLLSAAGFATTRVWLEALSHQWTPDAYFRLATGSGMNRQRLDVLDDQARAATLDLARRRIAALTPSDLVWSGKVVCAVATK